MNEKEFWAAKIVQLLHDPPAKPYFLRPQRDGHKELAKSILERVFPDKPVPMTTAPDFLATGADRPLPFSEGYGLGDQYFHKAPLVTHPLCRSRLHLPHPGNVTGITGGDIADLEKIQLNAARILLESEDVRAAGANELKKIFFSFWRSFRDEIIRHEGYAFLWQLMPADSRSPDHSVWDHNRMASALAFVEKKMEPGQEQAPDHPWLFSFSLRPVQEFLQQARKSQDLWTGSMLLAELAMAAMEPIIAHYGPDVIVYPDLRGNPRGDIWLYDYDRDALPSDQPPSTRAAVIPHIFVAILPRGDEKGDFLQSVQDMGSKVCERVHEVWAELAGEVQAWMKKATGANSSSRGSGWEMLWDHAKKSCPLEPTWVALPWPVLEKQSKYYWPGGALPFQSGVKKPSTDDQEKLDRRKRLLGAWMDSATWARYEYTLSVFARTNENLLLHSGFCYAPAHHRLKAQHGARRRIMTLPSATPAELSFEKCSLCHTRAALGNNVFSDGNAHCESIREQVRQLWKNREFDPEEKGSERLCAVCATKRFLVRADSGKGDQEKPNRFNRVWAGPDKDMGAVRSQAGYEDGRIRTPFPSTVQIAAQEFLVALTKGFDLVRNQAEEIIRLHGELKIPRSAFPDSLPALGRAVRDYPEARKFMTLDPQLALFPEMVASAASYENDDKNKKDDKKKETWKELEAAVKSLRSQCQESKIGKPATQLAVVCMDGDRMGALLLDGSPGEMPVCWKHILHPDVVSKIRNKKRFIESGWGDLLHLPRLAGPSLHAFISRSLADFSHTIVPWVVEQEFAGRLIYSGGDDLLALAPADQALDMADRLRTFYSSPWIMDTRPDIRPWSWLNRDQHTLMNNPKKRFRIISGDKELQDYMAQTERQGAPGRFMPMLGPGCTMSAGIMYGHFKTPLGKLLHYSHLLLDTWAKDLAGRNGAGLGHFSRGGVKTMFAASWGTGSLGLAHAVRKIRDGFGKDDHLPASLPYKLREQYRLLDPFALQEKETLDQAMTSRIMEGMLARAAGEGDMDEATRRAILALWQAGHKLAKKAGADQEVDHLAGLFFCRYLSARTGGES